MTDPTSDRAVNPAGSESDRRAELIAAALASDLSPAEAVELDALRVVDPPSTTRSPRSAGSWRGSGPSAPGRTPRPTPRCATGSSRLSPGTGRPARLSELSRPPPSPRSEPSRPTPQAEPRRRRSRRAPRLGSPSPRRPPWSPCAPAGRAVWPSPCSGQRPASRSASAAACSPRRPATPTSPARPAPSAPSSTWRSPASRRESPSTATSWRTPGAPRPCSRSTACRPGRRSRSSSSTTPVPSTSRGRSSARTSTIDCRMNAAVLREHVVAVEVRGADGVEIATASVPSVDA